MILKYEFEDNIYEYEVDKSEVVSCFAKEFKIEDSVAKSIMDEFDLWESSEERYEYDLKEMFEDDAYQQYEEDRDYDKDIEGYYGVSRKYD